jgi:MYXO-CTERM domain-containing protein
MFPGTFSDSAGNLLISSGFAEINLHDSAGKKVTSVSSPVTVRFEARPASWASLRDLEPDSGRIEVPMYSFDEGIAEWVTERPGELQNEDGTPISEGDFTSIQDGSYADSVYIVFQTTHFSTFNCDAPVQERGCVKGRIVKEGKALAGVSVDAEGVSYWGSAGEVITGADGWFAVDVMRSEKPGEDYDRNRIAGETFTARVKARLGRESFQGETFPTPGSVGSANPRTGRRCMPKECQCVDLGDVEVDFETPRPCKIQVEARASSRISAAAGSPLAAGDPLAAAQVTGRLSGALWVAQPGPEDCTGSACFSAQADENGSATFVVPVIGDAPKVELSASLRLRDTAGEHAYETRIVVDGCAKGEATLSLPVRIQAPYTKLGAFANSGSDNQSARPGGNAGSGSQTTGSGNAPRGGCGVSPGRGGAQRAILGLVFAGFALARRRRYILRQ